MKQDKKRQRAKKHRGNGEGSVYGNAATGYRAALTVGWKVRDDGTRVPIRKFFRGRTAEDAIGKRDDEKQKIRRGEISLAPEKQTVEQFTEAWLRAITPPIVRPKTHSYYTFCVRHINEKLGRIMLKRLTSQQIQEFLAIKLKDLSVKTCGHLKTTLKAALNWACDSDQIPKNPANNRKVVRLPKDDHEVRFMTVSELGAFRAAARGNWMEHAFTLALATGIREAEVLGLRWERIDLEKRRMLVNSQLQRVDGKLALTVPKSKKSTRALTLNQDALNAFTARRMQQEAERQEAGDIWNESGFVFTNRDTGAPIDQRTLVKYFYKARDAAAIKGLTFHGLRHTYASILLARGVPIKEVSENLGHADVAFTLRIYTHCMPGFRDKAATEMQSAFANADRGQREKEEQEKKKAAENLARAQGAATGAATGENGAIVAVVN